MATSSSQNGQSCPRQTMRPISDTPTCFTYNTPLQAERRLSPAEWEVMSVDTRDTLLPTTIGKQNETIAHWIHRYGSASRLTKAPQNETVGVRSKHGLYIMIHFVRRLPAFSSFPSISSPILPTLLRISNPRTGRFHSIRRTFILCITLLMIR
eukprot:scaffold9079_cov120-Cylindrotheca_fusiformis.AAC.13